ncbi:hypothetical protein QBC41DRAFT_136158 [Cercophora samala]|uniref:Uncharacterized protein n=1 Tax=Cercophora samala TaxID=330535 RepID=A0AA39ZM47_9PEZI|nr:hypothetical protein QBC41DRAFT_136158 [Cercophora samala]
MAGFLCRSKTAHTRTVPNPPSAVNHFCGICKEARGCPRGKSRMHLGCSCEPVTLHLSIAAFGFVNGTLPNGAPFFCALFPVSFWIRYRAVPSGLFLGGMFGGISNRSSRSEEVVDVALPGVVLVPAECYPYSWTDAGSLTTETCSRWIRLTTPHCESFLLLVFAVRGAGRAYCRYRLSKQQYLDVRYQGGADKRRGSIKLACWTAHCGRDVPWTTYWLRIACSIACL